MISTTCLGDTRCVKDRVIIQKLMQTVDDVHAMAHRFKNEAALVIRQHTAGWGHPENERIGRGSGLSKGVIEVFDRWE